MSHFIYRKPLFHIQSIDSTTRVGASTYNLYLFLQENPFLKSFSNISENPTKTQESSSPTISYLINSCGLSPQSALSASKLVHLEETQQKADAVLSFFRSHGFTKSHISVFITKCPTLLGSKPDKTLKPKIEFFRRSGISGPALAKILTSNPSLLKRSLDNQIVPCFDFLKSFLHSDEAVTAALCRTTLILQLNLHKKMIPNVSTLRSHGVPDLRISKLIATHPRTLSLMPDQFSETVHVIKEMGFDPKSSAFILAVRVMSVMSRSTWEAKIKVYRSLGWSEADVLSAFKKQPLCMIMSEEKIKRSVGFFADRLGMKPPGLCRCPNLLLLSLEKRIIPRCSVLQVLMSKSLIKKRFSIVSALVYREKDFLRKFVFRHKEEVTDLLKAYQGKVDFVGLGNGLDEANGVLIL